MDHQAIKVLSLLQPWASLAVMGIKKIETRSWTTGYRGRLLIHASKGRSGKIIAGNSETILQYIPHFNDLSFGVIIGEVMLKDVLLLNRMDLENETLKKQMLEEQAFGAAETRYGFVFEDAVLYEEPIPATGKLGIWSY